MSSFPSRTASAVFDAAGSCRESPSPWSILLAGGNGTRLKNLVPWFHSDGRPKQFATLIGTRSMAQHTYDRARGLSSPDRILAVLTSGQERWARGQFSRLDSGNILVQPKNLGTGPAICLAVARAMAEDPRASVVIYPTDHFIYPEDKFLDCVAKVHDACNASSDLKVVLLGAEPSAPTGGMGWIVPGKPSGLEEALPLFEVERFIEKPTAERATKLLSNGVLWNTFIMVGRALSFWHLLWKKFSEAARTFDKFHRQYRDGSDLETAMGTFQELEPFDFSHDLLARAQEHLLVCPLYGVRWRDWGTPESFFETLEELRWMGRVDEKVLSNERSTSQMGEYWLG